MKIPALRLRREAIERVTRQQEEFLEAYALNLSFYGGAVLEGHAKPMFCGDVKPAKPVTTKCPACGSHEFRTHNLVRVCSYCRCAS